MIFQCVPVCDNKTVGFRSKLADFDIFSIESDIEHSKQSENYI